MSAYQLIVQFYTYSVTNQSKALFFSANQVPLFIAFVFTAVVTGDKDSAARFTTLKRFPALSTDGLFPRVL